MIEILSGFPDNVVAASCSGHVTRRDYEEILVPAVERAFKTHTKVRLFYRIGPKFELIDPGAMLEDIEVGFSHLSSWERIAVVTDVGWIKLAARSFAFLIPGAVKFFNVSHEDQARHWIIEGETPKLD